METLLPPLAPSPSPKWPKIIGIIAIVFAVGGLFQCLTAPLGNYLVEKQMDEFAQQGADQTLIATYLAQYSSILFPSIAALGLLATLLLTGGILLLRKRPLASPLLQSWAVLKILAGGYFLFKTAAMTRLQMAIMLPAITKEAGSAVDVGMFSRVTSWSVWFGLGTGLLFLALFPVFLIFWFNRHRTQEEMARW